MKNLTKTYIRNPDNLVLDTDGYKKSHAASGAVHQWGQYPPGTRNQWSYVEARKGGALHDVTFIGLQMYLERYLSKPITRQDVDEAEAFNRGRGIPFDRTKWDVIVDRHGGFLPIEIQALPEGTTVPVGTPLVQVFATSPDGWWIPSWIETQLQRAVWYPSTVCTISRHVKRTIKQKLEEAGDDLAGLMYKLHDFGSRGVSSRETAALGGVAHLVNFEGTDTDVAMDYVERFYGARVGTSIPAMEHSSVTAWTETGEVDAFRNMIEQFGAEYKLLACVSDSYDLIRAIEQYWGDDLLQTVKDWGGTIVIRPDSGDPVETPVAAIKALMQKVGYTLNRMGLKLLPPYFRMIQGDGMTPKSIERLMQRLIDEGISPDNFAFGMGGGLLQKVDRDTLRFAQKLSQIEIDTPDGVLVRSVQKMPKTDPTKASKAGVFAVIYSNGIGAGTYRTIQLRELDGRKNYLEPVWRNGELLRWQSFESVRANANVGL